MFQMKTVMDFVNVSKTLVFIYMYDTVWHSFFVVAVIFAHTWIKGVGVFPRVFVMMNSPDIHKNHCVGGDVIAI